jgi:hypothetical protein
MNGVATSEYDARNQHLIADFERENLFFGEGKAQLRHTIYFNPSGRECPARVASASSLAT